MASHNGPVLITGATGLLGSWLLQRAQPDTDVVAVTYLRSIATVASVRADLRDEVSTRSAVDQVRPSLVIHAAYAKDYSSIVDATRHVVSAAASVGAPVLFISSDVVFPGDGVACDEHTTPAPVSEYGQWKAAAEGVVTEQSDTNSVIRLPLLMSVDPDDPTVAKIRDGAAAGEVTNWYSDEIRQPALTAEVAGAIWRIAALDLDERSGFWHLAGARSMSRFELAEWVVSTLDLPRSTIESVLQPGGGTRPKNLKLTTARAQAAVNWRPSELG